MFILPFWSQSDAMNWDSNYAYLRRVLPLMAEGRPRWLWLVAWPEGSSSWRWRDDGLFSHPRIRRFPWPYDTAMRSSVLGFHPERFHKLEEEFAPTIFWMHQVESGSQMMGGYRQSFNAMARPYMIAQHHYIIHKSLPYQFEGLFPRLWQQIGGTLAADAVVLNSSHTGRMMRESFGLFLNASTIGSIDRKTTVLPFGLIDDSLAATPITAHDRPVVVWNHRFENYKQPKVTGAQLTKLRSAGIDFEVWATQYVDQKVSSFPVDRVVGDPDYHTYISNIAVPGVNTINSLHETFCISAVDSLMLGHLLVAPRAITFPELVPPDYPYLFGSEREQYAMLHHILSTWPAEYEKWSATLRAFVAEKFALSPYVDAYLALMDHADDKAATTTPKASTVNAIERLTARMPKGTYSIKDAANAYRKVTGLQRQAAPNRRIIRDLTAAGADVVFVGNQLGIEWRG